MKKKVGLEQIVKTHKFNILFGIFECISEMKKFIAIVKKNLKEDIKLEMLK